MIYGKPEEGVGNSGIIGVFVCTLRDPTTRKHPRDGPYGVEGSRLHCTHAAWVRMSMQQLPTGHIARAVVVIAATLVVTAGLPVVAAAGPTSGDNTPENVRAISSCGTITEPGQYVLQANITDAPADGCFDVRADDVTILGANHVITTANGTGVAITATGVDDLTVRNLKLDGWGTGVSLSGVEDSQLIGLSISDAGIVGVSLAGQSENVTISHSTVTESTVGVRIGRNSEEVVVAESQFGNLTGAGVDVSGPDAAVRNNTIEDTGAVGVRVSDAKNALVADNQINRTIGGIVVTDSTGAVVRGNELRGIRGPGVHVTSEKEDSRPSINQMRQLNSLFGKNGGNYWTITGLGSLSSLTQEAEPVQVINNTAMDASGHGILVTASETMVAENTVMRNSDGIRVSNVSDVTVENNTATDNRDDGVVFSESSDGVARGNNLSNNFDDGLYIIGNGSTVTDNVAMGNGDDGVDVQNSTIVLFSGNRFMKNGDDGLYFRNVDTGNVTDNVMRSNVDDGVDLRGSTGITVRNNSVCQNLHMDLVQRQGSHNNTVVDNGC